MTSSPAPPVKVSSPSRPCSEPPFGPSDRRVGERVPRIVSTSGSMLSWPSGPSFATPSVEIGTPAVGWA